MATWDDSTSEARGTLLIYKDGAPSNFLIYQITGTGTDNGAYDSFDLTFVDSGGLFSNGDVVKVFFARTGDRGTTGVTGDTGATGPNFLSLSSVSGDINKNRTFVLVSGGSFTAGTAYCAMEAAPGAGKVDNFVILVGGAVIGTCTVSGTSVSSTTTLTSTSIVPGTIVRVTTNSTGTNRDGSLAIGR